MSTSSCPSSCVDGRTIRQNAFKECDGKTVPIVWSHMHDDPDLVLGHALLENHPNGVRMYGKLNDSPKGRQTKLLIEHGDIVGLSIWANQLQQSAGDVLHGVIREVSVVLAGANPGAYIDTVNLAHSDDMSNFEQEEEAIITTGEPIELFHAAVEAEDNGAGKKEAMAEEKEKKVEEPETEKDDNETNETVGDVFNTLTDKQKTAVYAIIAEALNDNDEDEEEDKDDKDEDENEESEEEKKEMKHNVFDVEETGKNVLSHDDMKVIMADAKRLGSLKEAVEHHMEEGGVLAHAVYNTNPDGTQGSEQTYGIADINWLFPEARKLDNIPPFIKRNDEWVNVVINGTHHTPFVRIREYHQRGSSC